MTPSVLYLADLVGSWWPGVSRQCAICQGRLLLVDDEVQCFSCSRAAYRVTDRPRPSALEVFQNLPPPRRGRPPKGRRQKAQTATHCANGHPWTTESMRIDNQGYRVCRICKRENWLRSQGKLVAS